MVIILLKTLIPQKPCEEYGVTLDNLFTSTKLLVYLSAEGFGARETTRTNTGVHQDLINFKKSDTNDIIPWGTRHLRYITDGAVTQLGWKDSCYCLFMSNMDCGVDTVITGRKRPNETTTCAKTALVPFSNQAKADLPCPTLTYLYNTEMNQVDRGDQRRAAYPIQQQQQKGWKAVFYTIIGIVVVNSFILSSYAPVSKEKKFTDQRAFREMLHKALFVRSTGADAARLTGADAVSSDILPIGPVDPAALGTH